MKKKKKKDVGITEHLVFPGELRTAYKCRDVCASISPTIRLVQGRMPIMMIGWVQNETHILYHFESLS